MKRRFMFSMVITATDQTSEFWRDLEGLKDDRARGVAVKTAVIKALGAYGLDGSENNVRLDGERIDLRLTRSDIIRDKK